MKRRLTALVLSMLMLLSAFSLFSCSEDKIDRDTLQPADDNTRVPVSLNFFIITDERTTDEAKQRMQDAFNLKSENEYRTHVEFTFCTEEQYASMMEEKFAAIESGEVTSKGEYTDAELESMGTSGPFPEIEEGQIDIVLVTGKEMLEDYVSKGRLKSLNKLLDGDFKAIRSYINTDLYNGVALDGTWYSVPNNKVLGEYTYLMINKEIAEDSYFNKEDFYTIYGAYNRCAWNYANVLKLVEASAKKNELNKDNEAYTPLIPLLSTFKFPTAEFWMDGGASVYATLYDANTKLGDQISLINPFTMKPNEDEYPVAQSYINYLKLMTANKENGYTNVPEGATDFAVGVLKGDYSLRKQYEDDYMVMILDNPRIEEEDIFSSMLTVSSYTRHSERALEIIADLTMKQELRNILLYGEEGTHYESYIDRDSNTTMVKRVSSDYMMPIEHTGNMFMAYPCVTDGQDANVWNEGMLQNNQTLRRPTYGFDSQAMWDTLRTSLIDTHTLLMLKPIANRDSAVSADVANLENYLANWQKLLFKDMFPEHSDITLLQTELQVAVQSLIDRKIDSTLEELRILTADIADDIIADAAEISNAYVARLEACATVEEFEELLDTIVLDMQEEPLFTCSNDDRGTPLSLFNRPLTYRQQNAKSSLVGVLGYWLLQLTNAQ